MFSKADKRTDQFQIYIVGVLYNAKAKRKYEITLRTIVTCLFINIINCLQVDTIKNINVDYNTCRFLQRSFY